MKTCLFLGGSVAFGLGATSDENTIPGRVGHYLNKETKGEVKYQILNYSALAFNSLQELISYIQSAIKPDYVIALSGFNDFGQTIVNQSKVSPFSQSCDVASE